MSTSEENVPNIVTVIKTEPEMEGDLTEDAETDDAFEQIFIKEEAYEEMECSESVTPGINELDRIKNLHLNLNSELPVVSVKEEPEQPHNSGTGDVAEKMRSRFLQILRKQSNSSIATREEKLPQDVVSKSTEDTTYILPDDNISDEEEDSIIKDDRNKLRGSSTTSRLQNRLQPTEEICGDEYICDICNGAFENLCLMERHRSSHTTDQPLIHPCKTCGRLFSKMSSLRRHEHTHMREPAVCEDCGRRFKYHSQLRIHRKRVVHRKNKRYTKCELWKWMRETKSN